MQKLRQKKRQDRRAGIQLEELDYLRLLQARAAVDAALLEGGQTVRDAIAAAEEKVQTARALAMKALAVAGKKYKFDPAISLRFDDARHMLIPDGTK